MRSSKGVNTLLSRRQHPRLEKIGIMNESKLNWIEMPFCLPICLSFFCISLALLKLCHNKKNYLQFDMDFWTLINSLPLCNFGIESEMGNGISPV
jgi:hypothetical protein